MAAAAAGAQVLVQVTGDGEQTAVIVQEGANGEGPVSGLCTRNKLKTV